MVIRTTHLHADLIDLLVTAGSETPTNILALLENASSAISALPEVRTFKVPEN